MTTIDLYQLDAFAEGPFSGNPAAVCPLTPELAAAGSPWPTDALLQAIAAENNLSETAFLVSEDKPGRYLLRWFTPASEIDLCGHATLAAGWVVCNRLEPGLEEVVFASPSGELGVRRVGDKLALDFPARPPQPCEPSAELLQGLGAAPREVLASRDYLCVYDTPEQVAALAPDMDLLARCGRMGVIVTAQADPAVHGCEFVSRFFAPAVGIAEDPVTGSAHCTLVPFWAGRLGKVHLVARQTSKRGGLLDCTLAGDRVRMAGTVLLYLEGRAFVAP